MHAARYRPWLAHGAFSLILFLITAATYSSLGVVLPAMVRDLGWSWGQAGLGFTLMGAATGASSWFPAMMIRRLGLRATLACGSTVMVAGLLGFAHADSIAAYLIGAVLCGAGFQMMALIPGTYAIGQLFTRKAMAFGVYFTLGALGGVVGPLMAEQLAGANEAGWRGYWMLQAALAAVVGLIGILAIGRIEATATAPDAAPATGQAGDFSVAQALRTPQFYILMAAYFSHLLAGAVAASLSVAHLTERGATATAAGLALSLEGLLAMVARLAGGYLAERIDPRILLVAGQVMLAAGSAALAFGDGAGAMLVYAAGIGIGFGLTVLAVTVLLLEFYGPRHNLEIFALTCLIGAASAIGPLAVGASRDLLGGFAPGLYGMAALIGVIAAASALMRRPRAPRIDSR
jgi:MFS family permease